MMDSIENSMFGNIKPGGGKLSHMVSRRALFGGPPLHGSSLGGLGGFGVLGGFKNLIKTNVFKEAHEANRKEVERIFSSMLNYPHWKGSGKLFNRFKRRVQ